MKLTLPILKTILLPFLLIALSFAFLVLVSQQSNVVGSYRVSRLSHGLKAIYYHNRNFSGSALTRTDPTIDFDWGSNSPDQTMAAQTFSVRWEGQLEPPDSTTYTFYTQSDDGVRLWVNNQLIVNNWTNHPPTENSGSVYLAGRKKVNIKIEYYQSYGDSIIKLLWSNPYIDKQIVPQSVLIPDVVNPTPIPIPSATPVPTAAVTPIATTSAATTKKYAIHVGSYSMDRHDLTQGEVEAMVKAIVNNIPNANYIAIGTYLDYPDQLTKWANSIHAQRRQVFFRSAGFNWWQGTNGVTQYSGSDFTNKHRQELVNFLRNNSTLFQPGDVFECIPDEPENTTSWQSVFGGLDSPAGIKAFNDFIQSGLNDCSTTFSSLGLGGVETSYVFTNPAVSKDAINSSTASKLKAMGTDNYPEIKNETPLVSALDASNAMRDELTTWVLPSQGVTKPKHITMGPSIYTELPDPLQAEIYDQENKSIYSTLPNLDGITIWEAGSTDNIFHSRLFNYNNGTWTARAAAKVINSYFGANK